MSVWLFLRPFKLFLMLQQEVELNQFALSVAAAAWSRISAHRLQERKRERKKDSKARRRRKKDHTRRQKRERENTSNGSRIDVPPPCQSGIVRCTNY